MSVSHRSRVDRIIDFAPPEALFVASAVAQYAGAVVAIDLFDRLSPATVAWLRVLSAGAILLGFSFRRAHPAWTRRELMWAAAFGTSTALMNMLFYLGIDRLPLGKGVTIEFIGPITVAALRTRSARNTMALVLATAGVVVLGGVELASEPLGLAFILGASVMWAGYIVIGSRVALGNRGVSGLAIGLLAGGLVITPFCTASASTALSSPHLLGLCVLVGLLSNAIGYGIDQTTLRRIPVRRFSVMLALLPVCAAVFGFVFLDQTPSGLDIMGMVLVLIGVATQERDEIARHHQDVATT